MMLLQKSVQLQPPLLPSISPTPLPKPDLSPLDLARTPWPSSRDHDSSPLYAAKSLQAATAQSPPSIPHPTATKQPATSQTSKSFTSRTGLPITIRPATLHDAAQIANLGSATFASSFGFSIPSSDLNAYLESAYALEAISQDICDASKHILVATCATSHASRESRQLFDDAASSPPDENEMIETEMIIGFAQLTATTSFSNMPSCLSACPPNTVIELQRLYVHPLYQFKGIGSALLSATLAHARSLDTTSSHSAVTQSPGLRYIYLSVWEGHFATQTFLERQGFERVGEQEFTMGRCVQCDWVMLREL